MNYELENTMQEVNIIMSQNPAFNFVGVRFLEREGCLSHKTYYYKTVEQLAEGDQVVVAVGADLRFKVAEVVEIDCMYKVDGTFKYKWIVQKIDSSTYEDCLKVEHEVSEALVKTRMNKIREEIGEQIKETIGKANYKNLVKLVDFSAK